MQVAKGRRLTVTQVRDLAKGRVWTGEAALRHKLVDQLGGLHDALQLAKQHAGLPLHVSCQVSCLNARLTFGILLDLWHVPSFCWIVWVIDSASAAWASMPACLLGQDIGFAGVFAREHRAFE